MKQSSFFLLPWVVISAASAGCSSSTNENGSTNGNPSTNCQPACSGGASPAMNSGGAMAMGTGGTSSPGVGGLTGTGGSGGAMVMAAGGMRMSAGGAGLAGAAGAGAGGTAGSSGMPAATGGTGGSAGTAGGAGAAGTAGAGGMMTVSGACGTVPAVSDYAAAGPFTGATMTDGSGPNGMYTIIKPGTLGQNGFKHPIATWGNGITTTPSQYRALLTGIASHGFVIIASDSTNVTAQLMTQGLDWLIAQNDSAGMFAGQLNVNCAASIGYSLGGGAAVTAGNHKNVMVTVSMHGLTGQASGLHGPLLLFTSVMDTFVGHAMFVDPNYKASPVQTFYATLVGAGDSGHLTPLGSAGPERAPMIAWLRLWIYGDEGAKKYFYGDDCILCKDPWGPPQDTSLAYRKNWK